MNKSTLKALKGSIQKWHDIAYHNGEDLGTENCALCAMFFGNGYDYASCAGCPVREHTGRAGCFSTPYTTAWDDAITEICHYTYWDTDGTPIPSPDRTRALKRQRQAAIAELKFLVTLMPVGEQAEMSDGTIWYCAEE